MYSCRTKQKINSHLKICSPVSSSSCMRVMNHNWSATKQRLHPECSRDKLPFSFARGQDPTKWYIVWISPQGHRSVSVSRHFLLQAPQCPCSVRKRFSRDHCCRGRSKPGCRIVGSHTRWELTTWADFQLCLHRLLMSTGCVKCIKYCCWHLYVPTFSHNYTLCCKKRVNFGKL